MLKKGMTWGRIGALVLGLVLGQTAVASHLLSGTLTYEYIGDITGITNQYRVKLSMSREVVSQSFGSYAIVEMRSQSCGIAAQQITLNLVADVVDTSANLYQCVPQSSAMLQTRLCSFEGTVIIPQGCSDIKLYWSTCCRPPSMTCLINPSSAGFYIEAELNTSVAGAYTSSASFAGGNYLNICSGNRASLPQGGIEPDGDSVRYELVPVRASLLSGVTTLAPYAGLRTYLQPIVTAPGGATVLDPNTGTLTVTPQGSQVALVTIRAIDYRWIPSLNRWVRMGSALRELVLGVSTQCASSALAPPVQFKIPQAGWTVNAQGLPTTQVPCGDTSLQFVSQFPLKCSALSASDFKLYSAQGVLVPLKRVNLVCQGGTGTQVELVFHSSLVGGSYFITSGLFDASTPAMLCSEVPNSDTVASFEVVQCPSPAVIACPGGPACPPSVSVTGPHTFYSSWSDPALTGIPPHTSTWTLTGGSLTTAAVGDTVQALITSSTATLVLETCFGLCSEFDTLVMASTVGLAEQRLPKLELRPNPAESEVWIGGIPLGATVDVVNALGQRVLTAQPERGTSMVLSVQGLARGTYWVVATSPDGRIQTPLVKL